MSLIGRKIAGRFEIEALVGEGAMGAVFRARQIALGTTVAVKVLHRPLTSDPSFAARFLREAQAASRIDHPSSMRVIDFGEQDDGLLFMATEYLDGRTLADVLDEVGPMPAPRIIDIASQILAALAVAHEMNVVHRDLKPENIMLLEGEDDEGCRHDIVKVCDFGVAKLLEQQGSGSRVTGEGLIVGTPAYMSPEQARGESLDARSDLYSMGVLLFQMMTGAVPFDATTAVATALMHVTDEPTRPRAINPSIDERLEAICLKAMRKRREDRFSNAREMRAELRGLCTYSSTDLPAPLPAETRAQGLLSQVEPMPRRSPLAVLAISATVLAVVIAAGTLVQHRGASVSAALTENMQDASSSTATASAASANSMARSPSPPMEPSQVPIAAPVATPPVVASAPVDASKPGAHAAPTKVSKPPAATSSETKSAPAPRTAKSGKRTGSKHPPSKPTDAGAPTVSNAPNAMDEPLPVFPDPPPEPLPAPPAP